MTRGNLYKEIVQSLLDNCADVIGDAENIRNELELNGLGDALRAALDDSSIRNSKFQILLNSLQNRLNEDNDIDDDINDFGRLVVEKASYKTYANKRDFIWHSQNFSVFNCDNLFRADSNYSDKLLLGIEQICYTDDNRKDFLNYLKTNDNGGGNDYYVIYDTAMSHNGNVWKLYMYGACLYLNEGHHFSFDNDLKYTSSIHKSNFNYNIDSQYDQYIDVYDVISEWNNCSDIISAFLKMYQILEYMVYRKQLVAIVSTITTIKQSFVRHIKSLDKRFSEGEREVFIRGLKALLPSFAGRIDDSLITSEVEKFCKKHYSPTKSGDTYMKRQTFNNNVDDHIAKFIYDTRCSIVHNKESEFHITMTNCDEYKAIIPLIKKILEVVGAMLFDVINAKDSGIAFNKANLELY